MHHRGAAKVDTHAVAPVPRSNAARLVLLARLLQAYVIPLPTAGATGQADGARLYGRGATVRPKKRLVLVVLVVVVAVVVVVEAIAVMAVAVAVACCEAKDVGSGRMRVRGGWVGCGAGAGIEVARRCYVVYRGKVDLLCSCIGGVRLHTSSIQGLRQKGCSSRGGALPPRLRAPEQNFRRLRARRDKKTMWRWLHGLMQQMFPLQLTLRFTLARRVMLGILPSGLVATCVMGRRFTVTRCTQLSQVTAICLLDGKYPRTQPLGCSIFIMRQRLAPSGNGPTLATADNSVFWCSI